MSEYILSIDASLSSTGWAVIDKNDRDIIELGKICSKHKQGINDEDDRIMNIVNTLIKKIEMYSIVEVAIEDSYMAINMKTGMQLSKLRGGIMVAMKMIKSNMTYMQPANIRKLFMGKGNVSKEEIADKIINIYTDNTLVKNLGVFSDKSNKAKNSDMYDAISIGVAYIIKQENNI